MSTLTPRIRVSPQPNSCPRCGHAELITFVRASGTDRLWVTLCPACRTLQHQAAIPEWFVRGLPAPIRPLTENH